MLPQSIISNYKTVVKKLDEVDEALYAPDINHKELMRLCYELVNASATLWFSVLFLTRTGEEDTESENMASLKEKG